jgi:hypothetical protein
VKRIVIAFALLVVGVGAAFSVVVVTRGGDASGSRENALGTPAAGIDGPASLRARFAFLSDEHSNRCGMPASALMTMPAQAHLQGACCFPMDFRSYVNQVRALRRYAAIDVIPKDPYDIPVTLARRLVGYQAIRLAPAQQKIYERAKPISATKGPCCCPCWRWDAFEGQAKYLITRRQYTAQQIADVWTAEEGCGGPSHRRA